MSERQRTGINIIKLQNRGKMKIWTVNYYILFRIETEGGS